MGNDTKQNILRKKKIKQRRRRLRVGRLVFFLLLLACFTVVLGFCGYYIYRWGADGYRSLHLMYAEYQMQAEMKKNSLDPRFANYNNILLLGIDDGVPASEANGRWADTIILASFRRDTGEVRLLSIPRDTLVTMPGRKNSDRINASYYYGGAPLAVQAVSKLLNVPIQEYVTVDVEALTAIVDALGGIDLYVEADMEYEDPVAGLTIHLQKGYQHLDGDMVQQYLRYRSDDLGDIGRVQRQQRFLKALYRKCTQLETLPKLPAVADILSKRISSSVRLSDGGDLLALLKGMQSERLHTVVLPGVPAPDDSYWLPDAGRIENEMQELFPEMAAVPAGK